MRDEDQYRAWKKSLNKIKRPIILDVDQNEYEIYKKKKGLKKDFISHFNEDLLIKEFQNEAIKKEDIYFNFKSKVY